MWNSRWSIWDSQVASHPIPNIQDGALVCPQNTPWDSGMGTVRQCSKEMLCEPVSLCFGCEREPNSNAFSTWDKRSLRKCLYQNINTERGHFYTHHTGETWGCPKMSELSKELLLTLALPWVVINPHLQIYICHIYILHLTHLRHITSRNVMCQITLCLISPGYFT